MVQHHYINLIDPWKVNVGGSGDLIIKALTVINICTTLGKIICIDDSTTKQVSIFNSKAVGLQGTLGLLE
jgi:hypothetical protein